MMFAADQPPPGYEPIAWAQFVDELDSIRSHARHVRYASRLPAHLRAQAMAAFRGEPVALPRAWDPALEEAIMKLVPTPDYLARARARTPSRRAQQLALVAALAERAETTRRRPLSPLPLAPERTVTVRGRARPLVRRSKPKNPARPTNSRPRQSQRFEPIPNPWVPVTPA